MIPHSTETVPPHIAAPSADSEQRRRAFVSAGREAFFAHGYAGTTMSAIASRVGGSKTTLWSYFPSKQDLFVAVVDEVVEQYSSALTIDLPPDVPVEQALRRFGSAMMDTILSPPIIALHRIVTGEGGRFPELGALFYERGPRRGKARLADYMRSAMADGRLRAGDPAIAARQFAAMCQSGCLQQILVGAEPVPAPEVIARQIDDALRTFLHGWQGAR